MARKAFPTKQKTKNKVAIVGFAASSRTLAPFDDEDFEIWGCNALGKQLKKRFDRMFDLHLYDGDHPTIKFETRLKWYAEYEGVVYMQRVDPNLKNSMEYPKADIVQHLAPWFPRKWVELGGYFTNTIGYMLAMAICEDFDEIHCYGVDMVADSEYLHQKANVETFLALASGMGKKIHVPAACALLVGPNLYAYEDEKGEGWIREEDLVTMMNDAVTKHAELTATFNTYDGVIQVCERLIEVGKAGQAIDQAMLQTMIDENIQIRADCQKKANAFDGSIQTFQQLLAVMKGRKRGVEVNLLRLNVDGDATSPSSTNHPTEGDAT